MLLALLITVVILSCCLVLLLAIDDFVFSFIVAVAIAYLVFFISTDYTSKNEIIKIKKSMDILEKR